MRYIEGPRMPETAMPFSYLDLIAMVWRRKYSVMIVQLLALAAGAGVYFWMEPVYESAAQMLVLKNTPQGFPGLDSRGDFQANLTVHQSIVTSPVIIEEAIKRGNLKDLESLRGDPEPVVTIMEGLAVATDSRSSTPSSNILTISYRSTVADDCSVVLNSIINSFQRFLNSTHQNENDATRELFVKWEKEIKSELDAKQRALHSLRESPGDAPPIERSPVDVARQWLQRIESELLTHRIRRTEIERRLKFIAEAEERGISSHVLAQMVSRWVNEQSNGANDLEQQMMELMLEEQELLTRYGPRHPEVLAIRKRVEVLRGQAPQGVVNNGTGIPTIAGIDPLEFSKESLRQELQVAREVEDSLTQLVTTAQERVQRSTEHEEAAELLHNEIAFVQDLYKEVIKRVQGLNMVTASEIYSAQLISPPENSEMVAPRASLIGALALVLGTMFGAVLGLVRESIDQRIRNPGEVRQRLGVSVVGHIPQFKRKRGSVKLLGPLARSLDPALCTFHRPNSVDAEAYRSLRTALYFNQQRERRKVLQITSPSNKDGKSTLVGNLGISMAQSGKRTLIIDADLRSPALHQLFGLPNETGFTSVLTGDAELSSIVQETGIARLSAVTAGPLPSNPSELLFSERLAAVLQAVREEFDFVLIDSSSVLKVTDPCVLAPQVDGVLLTVAASTGWPQAERSKEILSSLEAQVVGVVVNGTQRSGAYDFGPMPATPQPITPTLLLGDVHASRQYLETADGGRYHG